MKMHMDYGWFYSSCIHMFIQLPRGLTSLNSIEEDQTGQVSIQLLTGFTPMKDDTDDEQAWAVQTLLFMCSLFGV